MEAFNTLIKLYQTYRFHYVFQNDHDVFQNDHGLPLPVPRHHDFAIFLHTLLGCHHFVRWDDLLHAVKASTRFQSQTTSSQAIKKSAKQQLRKRIARLRLAMKFYSLFYCSSLSKCRRVQVVRR